MNASDFDPRYQDPNKDKILQLDITNSRKPVVTLSTLNKLKKMRAAKDLQELMRADFMEIMYGGSAEGEGAPGGGL
jgi:hypothetical protein